MEESGGRRHVDPSGIRSVRLPWIAAAAVTGGASNLAVSMTEGVQGLRELSVVSDLLAVAVGLVACALLVVWALASIVSKLTPRTVAPFVFGVVVALALSPLVVQ